MQPFFLSFKTLLSLQLHNYVVFIYFKNMFYWLLCVYWNKLKFLINYVYFLCKIYSLANAQESITKICVWFHVCLLGDQLTQVHLLLDLVYTWFYILECLFWENRLRSSFGFQLVIKPTFVSTIRVCTIESMPMACVDHLPHVLGISSYYIRSTNGTSLVAFGNTSHYKCISRKIMNSPHEYSSKFKGLFTNFS